MTNKYQLPCIKSFLLLMALLLAYFAFQQSCQAIDQKCFLLLNTTLLQSQFGQWFWGMLSHKNESWINVVVMLAINLWSIILIKQSNQKSLFSNKYSNKSTALVLYCWLSFQVVLLINILVFGKWLQIDRNSPSVIISHPFKLSMLLNNPDIKDFSNNSFPAGHTLVFIYWILFINLYAPKLIKIIGSIVISVLILPRIITGAHWLSDVVFSIGLGWMYFNLSMWVANRYETIKQRIY